MVTQGCWLAAKSPHSHDPTYDALIDSIETTSKDVLQQDADLYVSLRVALCLWSCAPLQRA